MNDELKTFIANHKLIFVYDIGYESLQIMRMLLDAELINSAFVIKDGMEDVDDTIPKFVMSRSIFDISYVSALPYKEEVGLILANGIDCKIESELKSIAGLKSDNIYRDTSREIPGRLYRYMCPSEFIKLITEGIIEFSSPRKWDDKCEGYLYHAMKDEKGRKHIVEEFAQEFGAQKGEVEEKLQYLYENTRCKCLSGAYDSVVMWNAYANNNETVMLEFARDDFVNVDNRIILCPISYVNDDISLVSEMRKVIKSDGIINHSMFTTKKISFSYEDEIRAFYRAEYPIENNKAAVKITPKNFIKRVLIHPNANIIYYEGISKLCNDVGVPFAGRSKVFDYR